MVVSFTQTVAPHLPYLRRYARAFCGSQSAGDAFVRATLAALLENHTTLAGEVAPRVALFRAFQSIWESNQTTAGTGSSNVSVDTSIEASPAMKLMVLAPPIRAALLLTAVEAFSLDEAAFILGKSPADIEAEITEAPEAINRGAPSRVLIIEDEPIAALDLESYIVELGHKVVGVAATCDQAITMALAERPGLVLADVNLGKGGSGITAVETILKTLDIPVIFITAYPEMLPAGEQPEPTYLIAKPYLPETVQASVGQALFFHTSRRGPATPAALEVHTNPIGQLAAKKS